MTEDTQKRYNPLFEIECSERKESSRQSGELELLPSWELSNQCHNCKTWVKVTRWSRFLHKLVCWSRQRRKGK